MPKRIQSHILYASAVRGKKKPDAVIIAENGDIIYIRLESSTKPMPEALDVAKPQQDEVVLNTIIAYDELD